MLGQAMNGNTNDAIRALYEAWKTEDRDLEVFLDEVRDWMNDVSKLGIPRFGEAANRLQRLQQRLVKHFECEDEIICELETLYTEHSAELNAARRQASHDHRLLGERLEALIRRLDALDPAFPSWESAMDDVELYLVALEQHEDQESESIRMLVPYQDNN